MSWIVIQKKTKQKNSNDADIVISKQKAHKRKDGIETYRVRFAMYNGAGDKISGTGRVSPAYDPNEHRLYFLPSDDGFRIGNTRSRNTKSFILVAYGGTDWGEVFGSYMLMKDAKQGLYYITLPRPRNKSAWELR